MIAPAPIVAPFDVVEAAAARAETELFNVAAAIAELPADLWRSLPDGADALLVQAGPAVMVAAAVILTFALLRRALRRQGRKAGAEPKIFAGLCKLALLDFLALAAAALVGRVLLFRVLGVAHGVPDFPSDLTVGVVRWLLGLTLAIMLLRPSVPRFRLIAIDDVGARQAMWRAAIILAIGHLHIVLLEAAQRGGLPLVSVKLVSGLVGLAMAAGAIQLVLVLRHHGLRRMLRRMATGSAVAACLLWLWGWIALDFELYRGVVGIVAALSVALVLDRIVALGMCESLQPRASRMLLVLRVAVAALAVAVVLRIAADIWITGPLGWLTAAEWRAFSRRLNIASAMLVFAAALAAVVQAATEAWLTPDPGATIQDREAYLARLANALPIIRLAAFALIGVVFSLLALSALGVNVTALMVGAAIVGLAISFGLQSLVKDIVAGLFFGIEDAFRLGETIEFGGRHCQLERIDLRSARLRDQDGRLYTVPFGELGIVTNHSRRLVRMTALMTLDAVPAKSELVRFSRDAAAALRREPMISHAIIGSIGVRLNEALLDPPSTLALSFTISALAADRTRALVQRLFEETVAVAGIEALSPAVGISVSDLSSPPPSAEPDPAGELAL